MVTFKPCTRDLETIAELTVARAPVAKIAGELGIGEEEFRDWCARLAAARAMMMTMPVFPARAAEPKDRSRMATEAPAAARIVADRVFEAE